MGIALHMICVPVGVVVVPVRLVGKDESLGVTKKILVSHMFPESNDS